LQEDNVAVVIGVGPGLGAAVAKRFAREGYALALVARKAESSEPVRAEIEQQGGVARVLTADAGDPAAVAAVFAEIQGKLGPVGVLVYNAGAFRMGEVAQLTPEQFEQGFRIGCFGAFLCAREVVPGMVERGRGTLLFTGATASLRSGAGFAAFAAGKFGLRAVAQSLAREVGPKGVHVAHVIIDGQIDTPHVRAMMPEREARTMLAPDAIAESYWQLHAQHPSAWTHELDLRPSPERF